MLFMFPGQGSQKVGMGKDLFENFSSAKDVFLEVDEAIHENLSKIIFEGSEEDLKKTKNSQVALMTHCVAITTVLKKNFGVDVLKYAQFLCGHSLGEYTALTVDGVFSLSDSAKILKIRGEAMEKAFPNGGAMAALLGMKIVDIEDIIKKISTSGLILQIANDNSDGQVVISGHLLAIQKFIEEAKNAKKCIILNVSGPFHSSLMEPAKKILKDALDKVEFLDPKVPLIANFSGDIETKNFKELLLNQLTNRVRFRESILKAKEKGIKKFIEIGEGKVLTGLVKRTVSDVGIININSIESIEKFSASFNNS